MKSPTIAIVIPVYNETAVLPALWTRLLAVMVSLPDIHWRVIFVDDGSRDGSVSLIKSFQLQASNCTLLELSRNFGHQAALTAGITEAAGCDAAITMDADLQDPPEIIPLLIASWRSGAEVVLAVRRSREERGLRRLGFEAFHRLFQHVTDFSLRSNTGTFGLLSRPAIEVFNQLQERHRFFPGLRAWVGFSQAEVVYDRKERAAGEPAQSFRRLVRYAMDGVFSFSYLPLRLLTYIGIFVGMSGMALALYYVVKRLIDIETAPTGFTTLAALMLFIGGIQLIGIGILGEYLARVYDEVKQRPLYVVKRTSDQR